MNENNFTEIVGLAAGICTALSLLPQIIKIVREKKAQDISLFYLIVLLCGLGLWTYYGFLKEDVPIIATNIFSMVLNIIVIILGSIYKEENDPPLSKRILINPRFRVPAESQNFSAVTLNNAQAWPLFLPLKIPG